jgi:alpha-glucosidase
VNAASTWLDAAEGVLAFGRGGVQCLLNLSPRPIRLPAHPELLAASWPLDGGVLPPNCAVWLRTS